LKKLIDDSKLVDDGRRVTKQGGRDRKDEVEGDGTGGIGRRGEGIEGRTRMGEARGEGPASKMNARARSSHGAGASRMRGLISRALAKRLNTDYIVMQRFRGNKTGSAGT
jgi:hypothetical protein